MENDFLTNSVTSENNTEFTKLDREGRVAYIEREVDRFDFEGYEVVRREFFSKANCPAITIKYGSITFNIRAIRKLRECQFVQILINPEKKLMIVKPCEEDEKDSLQCSRVDPHGRVVPRTITGKIFTAQLYKDMNWSIESTVKILGTLNTCQDERIFIFDLSNAEAYLHLADPSGESKRRKRVPFMPEHWQGSYGVSYEESQNQIVTTFEGVPEGFVKITIPQLPHRKPPNDEILKPPDEKIPKPPDDEIIKLPDESIPKQEDEKVLKSPETILPIDFFTESSVSSNMNTLNERVKEAEYEA